ncbi:hypothetical protein [Aliiroseovarius sp. 2305UL8-7]|uniref:hypothetical protein n=1 Tax=Aliiroseovarius conchicola TaxID=3121637 RepID=UPI003527D6E1
MTQVIVHAGFHKTGTTSLQNFLHQNRKELRPYFDYYGQNDFLNAGAKARFYAQRPYPHRLHRFRRSFRRFLSQIPDHKVIILSRESFSGGMPGHRKLGGRLITSYQRPALRLARVIISELHRRFGAKANITFFYTTRDRQAWLKSVHGHLLRSINLADDFETFCTRIPDQISPTDQAQNMRFALSPIPVVTAALEDYADHPHGPAAALLDLVNVPQSVQAQLAPAPISNRGQSKAQRDAFLELNRSGLSKPELKSHKAQLLAGLPAQR